VTDLSSLLMLHFSTPRHILEDTVTATFESRVSWNRKTRGHYCKI